MGAWVEVSFVTQFFSIPDVTERKTRANQTTKEITNTDIIDTNVDVSDFFWGSKYLRAILSSNTYFASL